MLLALALSVAASPQAALRPFDRLVGHCWRGEMKPGVIDTHCFEGVLGGAHVRDRHEVTGGYAGETIYSWDGNAIVYTYWNSLGGVSRGTATPVTGGLDFGAEVHRSADGREVRLATRWRFVDANSYEAVTTSPDSRAIGRTVRFRRVK